MEEHQTDFIEFRMKVLKRHFSAFSRLIHEAVVIERFAANPIISVLNSKSEFGRVSLPRLTLRDEDVAEKESFLPDDGKISVKRDGKVGELNDAGPKDDDGQLVSQSKTENYSTFTSHNNAAGMGGGEDDNGASRLKLALTLGQFLRKSRRQFRLNSDVT